MIPGYTITKRYINKYFHKKQYKYILKNVHDGVPEEIV